MTRAATLARVGLGLASLVGLVGLGGCLAASEREPLDSAREMDQAGDAEPTDAPAPAPMTALEKSAPTGADSPATLEEMEQQLAVNEAKLRAMGLELPGDGAQKQAEAAAETRTETASNRSPDTATPGAATVRAKEGGKPGAGGLSKGSAPAPGQPKHKKKDSEQPKAKPGDALAPNKERGDKGGQSASGDLDDGFDSLADAPDPDEAKAAQGPVSGPKQEDAASRCESLCSVGEATCELQSAICVLADRHPDEDDYRAACERASGDCEVAMGACDACEQ